jgi:signal peptidase II
MFYLSALIVFLLDQGIKFAVSTRMLPNHSIPVIKNVLHLTYVQNRGAAFGLFYGKQWFLISVGIVLIATICYYYFSSARSAWMKLALGVLVGGSLGNMFDRIARHYVVDFIDFRVFPVFNLADTMINVGVFLIILNLLFSREEEHASRPV